MMSPQRRADPAVSARLRKFDSKIYAALDLLAEARALAEELGREDYVAEVDRAMLIIRRV